MFRLIILNKFRSLLQNLAICLLVCTFVILNKAEQVCICFFLYETNFDYIIIIFLLVKPVLRRTRKLVITGTYVNNVKQNSKSDRLAASDRL